MRAVGVVAAVTAVSSAFCLFAACVGDDPIYVAPGADGGQGDGAPSTTDDGGGTGTNDSGGGADANGGGGTDAGTGAKDAGSSNHDAGAPVCDPGDAGMPNPCTTFGANIAAWFVAADVVVNGVAVATWPSRAAGLVAIADKADKPSTSTSNSGGVQRPIVHFAGTFNRELRVSNPTNLDFGTDDFVAAAVVSFQSNARGAVFGRTSPGQSSALLMYAPYNNSGLFAGSTDPLGATVVKGTVAHTGPALHRVRLRRVNQQLSLEVDGDLAPNPVPSPENLVGGDLLIGADATDDYLEADIAEIVIASKPSAAQLNQLDVYLATKYP